jgi:hypothetical protein
MTAVVYARDTLSTGTKAGLTVHLTQGAVWAADDPICTERPDLFSPEPTTVCRTTAPITIGELRGEVEQATRNPGQRRNR